MKAIISTNYDPKYVFFMPIVAWAWNKLGVEVRFLSPRMEILEEGDGWVVAVERIKTNTKSSFVLNSAHHFDVPTPNHQVTYTQVSRLFAAADTQIPYDEILITSDIDMAVFELPPFSPSADFTIYGADLVPPKQYPMCYIAASAAAWRKTFIKGRTLQDCLDDALAHENCQHMKANLWARDQENAYNAINLTEGISLFNRAKEGTQFAANRVDRDNMYWYEDLINGGKNIMDAHLWRPGYTEENVEKIIRLFTIMYPHDSFEWIREYAAEFRNTINQ